jgi:hypothetical protein
MGTALDAVRYFVPTGTYIAQAGISFSVILFCMIQLGRGQPSDVYLPVLTGTAAYWLPSPKSEADRKAESTAAAMADLVASVRADKETEAKSKEEYRSKKLEAFAAVVDNTSAPGPPIADNV